MFRILRRFNSTKSSIPKGTILKGLNVYQGKSDPIAMDDSEYPSWLWTILEKEQDENVFSIQHLRKLSKEKIIRNSMNKK
jgi:large subunit ribosomal protein L54